MYNRQEPLDPMVTLLLVSNAENNKTNNLLCMYMSRKITHK